MMNALRCFVPGLVLLAACVTSPSVLPPSALSADNLAEYKTVRNAITAQITAATVDIRRVPYFGFSVAQEGEGQGDLRVTAVAPNSPAAKASIAVGDIVQTVNGAAAITAEQLRQQLHSSSLESNTTFSLQRAGRLITVAAQPIAASRPMQPPGPRAIMGVQLAAESDGVILRQVSAGSAAEKGGLKIGDLIRKLGDREIRATDDYQSYMAQRQPGDQVAVAFRRGNEEKIVTVTLAPETEAEFSASPFAARTYWKKETYRLAVISIDFADTRHSSQIPPAAWRDALFSTNSHTKTNATGATVFGSMRDYYAELSCGKFHVSGAVFDSIELTQKRADPSTAATTQSKNAFLSLVLDKLLQRDGADALKDFDGLAFIYAGERFPTSNRGSLFWPHRATLTFKGRRLPYFICPEGGRQMESISVFCHEFGHMLGLPDLYARPENPGSEGLGAWCAMSNEIRGGRPQHFSAWCKEQLGWLTPAVIDPRIPQKLALAPVEGASQECFKVLLRPDGSEYLLLENRAKKGFDTGLAGEGLLIWRIVANRPSLEESHGVEGPTGPRIHLAVVPYPSAANDSFTPHTTPSSRPQLGSGWPVYITHIRRLPDGRVTFHIGYEYH